jgi:hypothetical protein
MSYSFQFVAPTKEAARTQVVEEFDDIAAAQPVHLQDQAAAVAVVHAFIDVLADEAGMQIHVSCHGSVGYNWSPEPLEHLPLTSASITVTAYLIKLAE